LAVVGSGVLEACYYRAQGETWPTAAVHSAFVNSSSAVFALAGGTACGLLIAAGGVPAVACAVVLTVAGGYVGHQVGEQVWNWLSS
jgi:hypothetical protein